MPGAELRAAFMNATYGPNGERFCLGDVDVGWTPSWAAGHRTWAIVTAWNPHGVVQPEEHNAAAARLLLRSVMASVPVVNGEGKWAEEGILVSGVRVQGAASLGVQFGQAVVVFGVGRRAALVWLDSAAGTGVAGDGALSVTRAWVTPALPCRGSA